MGLFKEKPPKEKNEINNKTLKKNIANITMAIVTYASTYIGLVPVSMGVEVPWTTPPIISGFLLCGIRGALLQIVLLLISMAIYYPFFKMLDKQEVKKESIEKA